MAAVRRGWCALLSGLVGVALQLPAVGADDWTQLKFDSRRSGDAPRQKVDTPLGLVGTVPLGDAILTAPVVAAGKIFAVDAAGTAWCIDAQTLNVRWSYRTHGGAANCNNVSSPAFVAGRLHFGTMAGRYYVLDADNGKLLREIRCGEPIFSAPAVDGDRVYVATLGSRVYALSPDGDVRWTWDFVRQVLDFPGDRWKAADWLKHKQGRVTWQDQFACPLDLAAAGGRVLLPAGGRLVWLRDAGDHAQQEALVDIPAYAGKEYPGLFGLSLDARGRAFVQWHRRDNSGRVECLEMVDGKPQGDFVRGTETLISMPGLLSFSSVSVRGDEVFRCRPEQGFGLCRHTLGDGQTQPLVETGALAAPVLAGDRAIFGSLDGRLFVVPLAGGTPWSFATAWGRPITAPVAVAGGRVYFGCEDGYLYVLGANGRAALPRDDLQLHRIRTPLTGPKADARYDWFTNYGDMANSNANSQGIRGPLRLIWARRYDGTFKHVPVLGGGRMYTHLAEGQLMAVEQQTGRLLWRRWFPDVHLSFTSPLYLNGRLLVPQAGLRRSVLRCLDAATGDLLWEAPFSGSPSWSRQGPPVVHKNVVIYGFGSGRYAAQGTEKAFIFSGKPVPSPDGADVMSWIYTHDNPRYPQDNRPLLRAWDLETGKELWTRDFTDLGSGGNDCGLCLLGDTLYYSTFFGYAAQRKGEPGPNGVTAALDPLTGQTRWQTTDYYVTAGCTVSGRDGRLYLGGYNKPHERTKDRFVWCLDARDGRLVWQSDPVPSAVNVITVADQFVFTNASGRDGHVIDKATGKIVGRFNYKYACTRFTVSGSLLLGANMDVIDLAADQRLISTGPPLEPRECIGGVVSNGRLYYTAQASGLQLCQAGADEPDLRPAWYDAQGAAEPQK